MNRNGHLAMVAIQLRTGWKALAAWIVGLGALLLSTTVSISHLYDTPAKINSYARAVSSGSALEFINGHIYGISTLGGVIANEFGFIASFALPLMGIALVARGTRREEETGRTELLLAGRIGRAAPLVSAVLLTVVALLLTSLAVLGGLLLAGVETPDSLLYAAALGALGLVFAGVAAVAAQLVEHARGVYAIGLAVLVGAYLLRGVGAVLDNAVIWLSPLGWAQEVRAFGDDPRWWALLLSVGVAVALLVVAGRMTATRDLGEAPLHRSKGAPEASVFLQSRFGFALRLHRGAVVGWGIGAVVVSAVFGSVTQAYLEAVEGNPALQQVMGGSGEVGTGAYLSIAVLLLGLLCGAYVVQALGTLGTEEATGRLEPTLSAPVGRLPWLVVHVVVVLAGLVVIALLGAVALGVAAAISTQDAGQVGRAVEAVAAYLPALLVLAAVALVLFAARPRWFALAWVVFAYTAVVTFLGEPLSLPQWSRWLAPLYHVDAPPMDAAEPAALVALAAVAVVVGVVAFGAFRRRGIPQR